VRSGCHHAVTKGSSASISVEAQGEVAAVLKKDSINQMIANLRETAEKHRAKLVENQPGQGLACSGPADLETVSKR